MTMRTLYSRLALTLFVLLLVIGLLLLPLVHRTSEMYQQEVAQKLNANLAQNIVAEQPLISGDRVDRQALDRLFHNLMVINPSIEFYLLGRTGEVIAYSAPEGRIKRHRVDLGPVHEFVRDSTRFPLVGDDPRDLARRKVFSAARIPSEGPLQGYLYIILGSEKYDGIVQVLRGSYILRATTLVIAVAIGVALILGLVSFGLLTRRLSRLSSLVAQYTEGASEQDTGLRYPTRGAGDEIDRLGQRFNLMMERIDAQLLELEKTDSLRRELVANISHDLRTPLTNLHGYLETLSLKGEGLSQEDRALYLKIALSHSRRLSQLIAELFELARLDSCETVVYAEPFSLAELVQDVAQKFELRAQQSGVRLEVRVDEEAPGVHADIGMMQRVLENLIDNALRHTPRGGLIHIGIVPQGDQVMVRVADTGCGIEEEALERIFDRFHRADRAKPGSCGRAGLGLAIAKRILELHGSGIRVESRVDRGTTFSFCMPVHHLP